MTGSVEETDFEVFCQLVPQLIADVSEMMKYRNRVYRLAIDDSAADKMEKMVGKISNSVSHFIIRPV